MLKPSPSRNQRSKGLKVQRVLQVCLLLALGMWLLYQVKHSHDKKVTLDASFGHGSKNVHHGHELLNLGRKDLDPRENTAAENLKHEVEEEKLEEEDEESKLEESEDDERGVGDDEIDGHDQDKAEEEPEQLEDLIDEEDKEMGEGIEREEGIEKEDLIGDVGLNSKKAEKEDNAASSVIQNTHIVRTETENGALRLVEEEGHVKNVEKNELEILSKTYRRGEVNDLDLEAGDDGKADKVTYLISVGSEEKIGEFSLNIPDDISLYNSSMKPGLNEQDVNSCSVATPVGSLGQNVNDSNVQVADTAQNKHANETAKDEQSYRIATLPLTGNSDAAERELGDSPVEESAVPEKIVKLDAASETEESPASTVTITQNAGKDMNAKSMAEETDETSELSTTNVNAEIIRNELIDSSLYQEDKEDHIVLDTLPETNLGESNRQNARE